MSSTELSPGPATRELRIALGDRSYPIVIGRGLLARAATFEGLPRSSQALIVSNTTVAPIYAQALRAALAPLHGAVHLLELPDGEAYKDWATLNLIFDALLARGSDRKTVLYALGGGVVGDMNHLLFKVLIAALSALLVIAGLDYFLQRFRFMQRNRMSRQEVKEEYRQNEGDPAIKMRIRRIRMRRARQRMLAAVPKAKPHPIMARGVAVITRDMLP